MNSAGAQGSDVADCSEVLITDELSQRLSRLPDFAAENLALCALARKLASRPEVMLQKLVDVVLTLCRADSSGISFLEPGGNPEMFRWRAMAGVLAPHLHALIPRTTSPCGLVLLDDNTMLFRTVTAQHFPAVSGLETLIFETLIVPFHRDGKAIGTVWAMAHTAGRKFDAEDARLLNSLAHFASAAYQIVTALDVAETGRQELERRVDERTRALHDANTALLQEAEERARAEDALRQLQKMEAVGQLTGGIAHDFNNMLQGIGGSLELLQRRAEQGRVPDAMRYLENARKGVERAAVLTHRLLAFARRQTLQPSPIALDASVTHLAELIRRTMGPGIAVELRLADHGRSVLCDRNQLESALLNLAINARDAMPDGGTLTIATANRRLNWADLSGQDEAKPGEYLEISVTDSGTGMTPSVAARAFEPFFTTKPVGQGTGLGLSQLYGFARQSGGSARLESAPGRGTTVRLFLPRYIEAETPAPLHVHHPDVRAETRSTVLVVEDEAMIRAMVVETLREQGHVVLEAADGPGGLQALNSVVHVDLLVTDVGLPGMNGRQLADAARLDRPDLPVLLITGYAGAALDAQLAPGMQVLTKPFALDTLAAKTRSMVAGEVGAG